MELHSVAKESERAAADRRPRRHDLRPVRMESGLRSREDLETRQVANGRRANGRPWMDDQLQAHGTERPCLLRGFIGDLEERLELLSRSDTIERSFAEEVAALVECQWALLNVLEYVIDLGDCRERYSDPAVDLDAVVDWCIDVKFGLDSAFMAVLPTATESPP